MNQRPPVSLPSRLLVGLISAALAMPVAVPVVYAQDSNQVSTQKVSQSQIAALVAPIALYPDPLVAQVLMASTYPLEVAEAYNWQRANSRLSGNALNQALQQQNWDPSVKSLVSFPPVLGMMGSQLNWTQELGNAVLAQQSDVMDSIQELRAKAKASGALQSNAQQTVTTQGSGNNETIVIQPANPQVVYVPTYNPSVVYGGWPYPAYPPYAYYPPGYVAGTALLSFGVGMAVGAALWGGCHWGGGGWGGWGGGGNSLTVNNNNFNNFNRNTNNNWSGGSRSGTSNWSADSQRRANNLSGGGGRSGGGGESFGGGGSRDAQRDQLRQNLDHGGLSGGGSRSGAGGERAGGFGGGDRSGGGGERSGGFSGGDRSGGGSRDPGGFGDTRHSNFSSGDRFGGGGGSHFGGGGGGHFGGGGRR